MPRYLLSLEDKIRQYISKGISRGKIDVFISLVNMSNEGRNIKIDRSLAEVYINEMKALVDEYGIRDDISATSIMRMPDIITIDNDGDEDLYWAELQNAIKEAIENISESRKQEGIRLAEDIKNRLSKISEYVYIVEKRSADLLEEYKTKLTNRV